MSIKVVFLVLMLGLARASVHSTSHLKGNTRWAEHPPANHGASDPYANGLNIQLWTCEPGSTRQQFVTTSVPSSSGLVTVNLKADTAKCIDINNWDTSDGANVWLWDCHPSDKPQNQQWTYDPTAHTLVSNLDGKCLDGSGMGNMTGTNLQMWGCSGNWNQQFIYNETDSTFRYGGNSELCIDAGSFANCTMEPLASYPFCDVSNPVDVRVKDLVSRMTLVEKVQNLQNQNPGVPRLGVPSFPFSECLHGVLSGCGAPGSAGGTGCPTSFPAGVGLGATMNRTLWSSIGTTISTEARALNNQGVSGLAYWAPDMNLFRDPRWGRGQEVPGEDPFLNSEYVYHYSRGLQEGDDTRYTKVVSTCKHFFGYDLENWNGTDRLHFNAVINDQDIVEYYLPAFRACVEKAHVKSIMCSYNAVNGVPSCANGLYTNTIARGQWNFDGFYVSDCGAINCIESTHKYTDTADATCYQALHVGGTDLDCGSYYAQNLAAAVQDGSVSEYDVDLSLYRVYSQFFALGAMDPPEENSYRSIPPEAVDTKEARQLALEAAQQSIVLLQNWNHTLPLRGDNLTIAVIGPHANATEAMLSDYHGTNEVVNSHSPLLALQRSGHRVLYAQGCDIAGSSTAGFADAASAAKGADVAVFFLGLDQSQETEGLDRTRTDLPGKQLQLVQYVSSEVSDDIPIVVVLINGGGLSIEWIKYNSPAVVEAFYPGEMGGDAIASVLFGDYNPSGVLPYTVYPSDFVEKRSFFDMGLSSGEGITYQYYRGTPLWMFGYGLSYTTFSFHWSDADASQTQQVPLSQEWAKLPSASVFYSNVTVSNTGSVPGAVAVLAFVSRSSPQKGQSIRELFGFEKVFLQPGQSTWIMFSTPPEVLANADESGNHLIDAGSYRVTVGDSRSSVDRVVELVGAKPVSLFSLAEAKRQHLQSTMV